jgi:putative ABC transport system permease protein
MQKWSFYAGYALKSLGRGGQRVTIAVLCVTFGVMSLVAMQNLAGSIGQVILMDTRYRMGGDATLSRSENFLSAEQLSFFEKLQAEGSTESYTPIARTYSLMLRLPGSGKVTFASEGLGIDATRYPLYGRFSLQANTSLADAIREPGNGAITQELAARLGLKIGDPFIVTSSRDGTPTTLRLNGIIVETPDSIGGKVFYSLETARRLRGGPNAVTDVLVRWSSGKNLSRDELREAGWQINYASDRSKSDRQVAEVFDFFLKGAGLLGLVVGGIGVANTMLVLLAGRREEIAILKTLGFRKKKLFWLLGLETVILGAAGGILGVVIALALSNGLLYLFSQTGAMLLKWSFDPWLVLGGLAAGTFTALIFGMYAIVQASEVRPMTLLRQMPVEIRRGQNVLLALALAVPFGMFTAFILGSLWNGLLLVGIAAAGLLIIGGGLGFLLWLVLKTMPTLRFYLLKMARKNLSRRWLTNVFAMIALFTGIFSLTFAAAVIQASQAQFDKRSLSQNGFNLIVIATDRQEVDIRTVLSAQNLSAAVRYEVLPDAITMADGAGGVEFSQLTVQGRETLWDVMPDNPPDWSANPNAVYLPADLSRPKGTQLLITGANGIRQLVTVVGTYQPTDLKSPLVESASGLIVSKELALRLGRSQTRVTFALPVPADRLVQTSETLGRALPETQVVTAAELNAYLTQGLRSLFWFAVAMAGLAILAGAVLVANTVGLAMVERKREMGILKAVGYTRLHVLKTVLLEYGLLAVIAGVCAVVGVQIFMLGLALQFGGLLVLEIGTALGGIGVGLVVTLLTATLAAWRPLQVRPVVVLSRES